MSRVSTLFSKIRCYIYYCPGPVISRANGLNEVSDRADFLSGSSMGHKLCPRQVSSVQGQHPFFSKIRCYIYSSPGPVIHRAKWVKEVSDRSEIFSVGSLGHKLYPRQVSSDLDDGKFLTFILLGIQNDKNFLSRIDLKFCGDVGKAPK